ncbi:DsbA family oxidoreductase [Donghicola tyrosinivorans]|uniref:Putative DsbA family dithiol-disulfide isomerase n=1 Tax=Donghicola tyrosinivorans TaxID=1652492 RepID=A0A2T0WER2_9RHOB|nr:DsbA family oxidoreductase [Donghicola tyrosinivorans]PRY85191.1 putative DsbA family dithiol-disulfide isomerase [Donghicola tyrosinivorans]
MVKLNIFSDPICPWCYIGYTQLSRALEAKPDHPFELEWLPFQLNPEMPAGGMDRRAYLEAKFGGKDNAVKVYGQIAEKAEEIGLELNLSAISRTPNTLDAHRLIHWSGVECRQTPVATAMFQAYFQEGRDLSDHEVLADIADGAGLDAAVIMRLLASSADKDEIMKKDAMAREMGVQAVPTFVVAGQHAVPGAQPTELWAKVIDELVGA